METTLRIMHRPLIILLVATVLLIGLGASIAVADSDSRPFEGSAIGTNEVVNSHHKIDEDTPIEEVEDPVWGICDPLDILGRGERGLFCVGHGEYEVIATHLGRGTLVTDHVSDFSTLLAGLGFFENVGTFTFVAANGDELRGTLSGPIFFDFVNFETDWTFVFAGGTGRFEDASGSIAVTGITPLGDDPIVAHNDFALEGIIGY